jgi:GMP synthase (glutamine-hydrolysing)
MTGAPRLTVIEHSALAGLDLFEQWLDGLAIRTVRPYLGDPVPETATGGLIVLGGPMAATDDEVAPWLPQVRALLAACVATRTPALGICLGAQLLAVACGGAVERDAAPGRESGVAEIHWHAAADTDPLVAGLPNPTAGPSMHKDAISALPPGSTWLGSSAMYPHQAFRVGRVAWGLQFHPEVSLSSYRIWASRYPDLDGVAAAHQLETRQQSAVAAGRLLAGRFAVMALDRARSEW